MVKITKKSADNCTKKTPSNRGEKKSLQLPDSVDPEIIAYGNTDYNYWVTKPQIDNIVILGNPNIVGEEEERGFQKKLDGEHLEAQKRGKEPVVERVPQKEAQKKKSAYNHHFKIWYRPKNYAVHLFFGPRHNNQRFLKLDFSPWRLGPDGMNFFRCWYDEMVYHSTFDQLISAPSAIKGFDIAVDVLGIHVSDLVLNIAEGLISNTYFGSEGRAETTYYSKSRVYNKAKHDHKAGLITPYAGFYEDKFPVTRIE